MYQFFDTLTNISGAALYGATVKVLNYPSLSNATIYSTNGTGSPIANNTVTADVTGQVSFYIPDGVYELVYSYNATIYKTRAPVQFIDPSGFVSVTDTGSANAYVVSDSRLPAQLYSGLKLEIQIAHANTGASTLNLNSTGAKSITYPGGLALISGILQTNGLYRFEWDGTEFQLVGVVSQAQLYYPITAAETAAGVTPVNYAYPTLTVDRYGANTIPGTTDMTVAVNTAVAVATQMNGGVINYLAAEYLVGSSGVYVSYAQGDITHQGVSRDDTTIINGSTNQPAISVGNGVTEYYGGGIRQMLITQKSGVTAVNGNCAMSWSLCGQFTIADVFISNAQGASYRGVYMVNASQFVLRNLEVQNCLNDGITFVGGSDIYATDSRSDVNVGVGWNLNATQGGYFKGCTAYDNTGQGWYLVSGSPSTAPNKNNFFVQCVGDTSGSHNWQIGDSLDSCWVSCWGSTQQSETVNTSAAGFIVYGIYCNNLHFIGCIAENNNSHGIVIYDSGSAAPTYIELIGCTYGSAAGASHGNGQAASGGYGFSCNGAVNHLRLSGGLFVGNASGSISNTSSQSDVIINGNPVGYVAQNQGTSSIAISASSVAITHGLGFTPTDANIMITPNSSLAASGLNSYWVSAVGSTTFTVTANTTASSIAWSFAWQARYPGS
jgi:hypothetical protein